MSEVEELKKMEHLPKKPECILPLPEENVPHPIVLGGLSLFGDKGYLCPVVTLLMGNENRLWGWSQCLNDPSHDGKLYSFDTDKKETLRKTEIPNTIVYFQAGVSSELVDENADQETIKKVVEYVMMHISDDGPPPPHPDDRKLI